MALGHRPLRGKNYTRMGSEGLLNAGLWQGAEALSISLSIFEGRKKVHSWKVVEKGQDSSEACRVPKMHNLRCQHCIRVTLMVNVSFSFVPQVLPSPHFSPGSTQKALSQYLDHMEDQKMFTPVFPICLLPFFWKIHRKKDVNVFVNFYTNVSCAKSLLKLLVIFLLLLAKICMWVCIHI